MERMTYVWNGLFADPKMGRKLVSLFRACRPQKIEAGAVLGMEHEGNEMKRLYRTTLEAAEGALLAKGLMSQQEIQELRAELVRMENDPEAVYFKLPDVWVVVTR
jgi:hypothetical protein